MSKYTPHFQSAFGTADCDNSRHWQGYSYTVQVFDNEGRFIKCFGKEGPQEGELCEPRALVFTPSLDSDTPGLLVVAEMENKRVSMFSSEGQYLCSYGKGTDVRNGY